MSAVTTPDGTRDAEAKVGARRRALLPTNERNRWLLVIALGCLLLVALDAWWIVVHRHGYPLDIDEAGYTTIGLNDYLGLQNGGLHGWWEAVQSQPPNAPLLPAVTSLALLVNPGVLAGFVVLVGFAILLVLSAFGIAETLSGPRLGALVAFAVATSQGLFSFSREYIFALPTAAFLSCAVFALIRSDGLRSKRWAIACGVATGLMLLARTMSVAFVPGVLLAAGLVLFLRGRGELKNRLVNLSLLMLAGVAVAATWYWRNITPVADYLTTYGYGSKSQYYGAEHAFISWARVKSVAEYMIVKDLLAPLALLLLLGLVATAAIVIQHLCRATDRREELTRLLASDATSVLLVFVAGYAALMSSRNGGEGFTFPIVMLLPALAVLSLRGLRRSVVVPISLSIAAIGALNVTASLDISDNVSRVRSIHVPVFGYVPWVDGRPKAVEAIRIQIPGPSTRFTSNDEGWPRMDDRLADLLLKPIGPGKTQPLTGMASRNRALNVNTIMLASVLRHHVGLPLVQLEAEPADTPAAYIAQLQDSPIGELNALISMSSDQGDFPPIVTQSKAETAAKRLGFRVLRRFKLPDGRQLNLWLKRR
ncbi:MAG TPA: hypothetical protein VFS64_09760 [Solirubrobacterales bacterium]|nr:hypothetical protein [Solirubrobacterales bacterium]